MTRPAQILLVEDNRMDVELTLDAFEQVHLANQITVASDGPEALDYLFGRNDFADRARHPLPDLVLLDLKLPGIDGNEVLRRIKRAPDLRRIPVIILTSSREEGDREMCYDGGANSYLVKPLSFDDFIDVVHQVARYWLTLNVGPPEKGDHPTGDEGADGHV